MSMCYDDNARPPVPEGAHGSAHGDDIVLTASDGNRFAADATYPDQPLGAQVIIYPDVRGLHQFYKELALRFAESGVQALAIDYFGRTAGGWHLLIAQRNAKLRPGRSRWLLR